MQKNPFCHVVSLLDPRFEKVVADSFFLKKKNQTFIRPFQTVWQTKHNEIALTAGEEINIPDAEDFNIKVVSNHIFHSVISSLLDRHDSILLVPFTTSFLNFKRKGVQILGPDPILATCYDSKIKHRGLFKRLSIPFPSGEVFSGLIAVEEALNSSDLSFPFFIYSEYGSGGAKARKIENFKDLNYFRFSLHPAEIKNRFIVAEAITVVKSPNSTGIVVSESITWVLSVSDQILKETKYLGNIYPSSLKKTIVKQIIEMTRVVGKQLGKEGFRGLFGIDFVVTPTNNILAVDLNPRKQGGLLWNHLMFEAVKPKGFPSLLWLELFGSELTHKIDAKKIENPKIPFYWAHQKIAPFRTPFRIQENISSGEPRFKQDISFCESFFQKGRVFRDGSFLGHVGVTRRTYHEAIQASNKLVQQSNRNLCH